MREKLIELLEEAEWLVNNDVPSLEQIADHLIAHGVTIQTADKPTAVDYNLSPTEKWIPVTERLPESGKCVLVFSKDGMVAEGCYFAYDKSWTQFRWSVKDLNVTHWMPLPEPPKGE